MTTTERPQRKSPPDAFTRPGGYTAIDSFLTRAFERELAEMSPERKSDPFVEAGLRAVKQHLRESREFATPRDKTDDI